MGQDQPHLPAGTGRVTASIRFLGVAVLGWAGVRAVSLGMIPGTEALALDRPAAVEAVHATVIPPIEPTEFAPIDSPPPSEGQAQAAAAPETLTMPVPRPQMIPQPTYYVPYPVFQRTRGYGQSAARVRPVYVDDPIDMPPPRRVHYASLPMTTELPPARVASAEMASAPVRPTFAADATAPPMVRRSRRLELSSWALLRGKPGDILGANSLAASSGTLGGSQAGARLSYWVTPHVAASLRTSTPLGGARGGEVAAGVRYQPWLNIPFSVTAERRQRFGRAGGRNDFALFVEGGLWDRPMPYDFRLDAYAQAGVVGIRDRALFGDGAFTLLHPLWGRISGGFGMWGGAQPHLYRIDAGPRLSIRMMKSMRVNIDYRQRLVGTASPSSGPAVTIAGDF